MEKFFQNILDFSTEWVRRPFLDPLSKVSQGLTVRIFKKTPFKRPEKWFVLVHNWALITLSRMPVLHAQAPEWDFSPVFIFSALILIYVPIKTRAPDFSASIFKIKINLFLRCESGWTGCVREPWCLPMRSFQLLVDSSNLDSGAR